MPRTLSVFVILLLGFSSAEIYEVDGSNLQETIAENPFVIVEFFAPWCGACKKFAPEYELASQELSEGILFTAFDAWDEKHKSIAEQYNVASYPTIVLFQDGQPHEYGGDLNKEALIAFLKKKMRPAYVEIKTLNDATRFWKEEQFAILGFFNTLESEECQQYIEIAKKLKEKHLFGIYIDPPQEVRQELKISSLPFVTLLKRFDEGRIVIKPDEIPNLESLIQLHVFPLIDDIGKHNHKMYVEAEIPIAFVFVESEEPTLDDDSIRKNLEKKFKEIAKTTRRRLNFVFINWEKYGNQAIKLGLSGETVPSLAIEFPKQKKHYAFPETEDLLTADVAHWVNLYLDGKLEPTIISQEPDDTSIPVRVVGSNYHSFVHERNRHVLIEYWAPWCGHCKAMNPIYKQLAEEYDHQKEIVVAAIDATANDYDAKDAVSKYPTIRLYKLNEETPIEYNGGKSIEELRSFVELHTGLKAEVESIENKKDEL